jgi:hypothetical protein
VCSSTVVGGSGALALVQVSMVLVVSSAIAAKNATSNGKRTVWLLWMFNFVDRMMIAERW